MVNHTLKGKDGLAGGVAILDGGLGVWVWGRANRASEAAGGQTMLRRQAHVCRAGLFALLPPRLVLQPCHCCRLLLPAAVARLLPQVLSVSQPVALPNTHARTWKYRSTM